MAERPPHGWDEIPEGHEVVAVPEGPEWRTEDGSRACSRVGGPAERHQPCDTPSVLALQRGTVRRQWWHYCPEHSYGRWVEDGRVMHWILRKVTTTDA